MKPYAPLFVSVVATAGLAAPPPASIVFCAPGYPGSTTEAQATMDAFASALSTDAGPVRAVYHETEEGGLAAIRAGAALAVVPLPFFVKHAEALDLAPVLAAVPVETGATESWTLVAKKDEVGAPSDLAGWEILSIAGYSPGFVREVALAGFGPLPADSKIAPSGLVLSALRRAAQGGNVAVLLDGAQGAALSGLSFAKDLAVVHRSKPLPVSVVVRVGSKTPPARIEALVRALRGVGAEPLASLRLSGFVEPDDAALDTARKAASR
jgi:hypothetical protein